MLNVKVSYRDILLALNIYHGYQYFARLFFVKVAFKTYGTFNYIHGVIYHNTNCSAGSDFEKTNNKNLTSTVRYLPRTYSLALIERCMYTFSI